MKRRRRHEEAGAPTLASSAGQNTPSSSSSGCIVDTGGDVTGVQRGKKRAAEDPPADCGDDDSVNKKGEMEQQEDVSMECLTFQEHCDIGGLWMVACREPEEDVEDAESSGALEQDSFRRAVLGQPHRETVGRRKSSSGSCRGAPRAGSTSVGRS